MLFVNFNFVFENTTALLCVGRQPSLMFFFSFSAFYWKYCFGQIGDKYQTISCTATLSERYNNYFSRAGLNSFPASSKCKALRKTLLLVSLKSGKFIVISVSLSIKWHFHFYSLLLLFKLASRFPFNLQCYSLFTVQTLKIRAKETWTNICVNLHSKKQEILNKTDSFEPNYAL